MNLENPWQGFAHPDHQTDELEGLVRTLRYALIDLQKFWVEAQSIPMFMNGLQKCSLEEIEKIFGWIVASPAWNEKITLPRLVSEFSQPESRKKIQEFARSVLAARMLIEELDPKMKFLPRTQEGLERVWKLLSEAEKIEKRVGRNLTPADLEERIQQSARAWTEISAVQKFFERVSLDTGAPQATCSSEGLKVLSALDCIARMPEKIRPWRTAHVLDPSNKIRLQAWKDRARPILELRKRLETYFNLEAPVTIDELTRLAEALSGDGLFHQFKAPYREAVEKYRQLLQGGVALKLDSKVSGFQKAEKLREWISLLEQTRAYATQSEAAQAFAPNFKGIDTDFAAALEANAWSKSLRDEFFAQDTPSSLDGVSLAFDSAIMNFMTSIPEEKISVATQISRCEDVAKIRELLTSPVLAEGMSFAQLESERKKRCWDYQKLREVSTELGLSENVLMSSLNEMREKIEEIFFLLQRIESDETLRALLKEGYAGLSTDLSALEPCGAYVKSVKSAHLPELIESSLLSAHGPQRLADARSLVARCLQKISVVRDHYRRLETATRDQVRMLAGGKQPESMPVVELMERIQIALKDAHRVGDAVAWIRAQRDSGFTGLTIDRETAPSAHALSPQA